MKGAARRAWMIFSLCAFVLLGAVSAMSWQILRADRRQSETELRARLESQVRLALWRLDSRVTPMLARESARSHESFVVPSAEEPAPEIKLRFARRGEFETFNSAANEELRSEFSHLVDTASLERALPRPQGERLANAAQREQALAPVQSIQAIQNAAPIEQQQAYGDNEYRQRKANLDRTTPNFANSSDADYDDGLGWLPSKRRELPPSRRGLASGAAALPGDLADASTRPFDAGELRESVTTALWVGDELLLARRAQAKDGEWIEGAWVDWTHLRRELLTEVSDLFPDANLVAVRDESKGDTSRMLATLPLRLDPGVDLGPLLATYEFNITSVAVGLAFFVVVFVLAATAMLLRATLDLSERRGAFVSAVTHELRTPLTTFRMYTEMLSEDMVTDEDQRSRYIETLRKEAHRLDNLVENVLTYARIEDERAQVKAETHALGPLVEDISVRLRERAEGADFAFSLELDPSLTDRPLIVDRTALEQVLFNLVDNAAKYGRGDSVNEIELLVDLTRRGELRFGVRDYGPGILDDELTKVFRPFQKAEAHQAGTLPGVGLGLALCKRLAEGLGGELRYEKASPGARFVLVIPG